MICFKHYLKILLFTIVSFLPCIIKCQVCNGSLGDATVNITFGEGATGPSSYVPSSGYQYLGINCPNDGYYTITNYIGNCFGDTWHNLQKDHTGKGNFMLVNASIEPGDFFLTSVNELCPNTTYEFAAWICNVMKTYNSITPNVLFTIEQPDGTVLGSYTTGSIPVTSSPQWIKYGLLFTTPSNNATIVLRMRNNSPGGVGNDLALDDITFRPCGASVSASIQNNPDTVALCVTDSTSTYNFIGNASALYRNPFFQWQLSINEGITWQDVAGANDTFFLRTPTPVAGNYWYRLSIADSIFSGMPSCRVSSEPLKIKVLPLPVVDAGPDRTFIKNFPVTLHGSVKGEDFSYTWSPSIYIDDPLSLNPVVSPPITTQYTLSAQSLFNCKSYDSVTVQAAEAIFVPTAFTPNGDGLNDFWRIPFLDIAMDADVKVYNRWGALVYHVASAPVLWDGKLKSIPQPTGTYVYYVSFKNNKIPPLRGTFTLIR